MISCGQVYKIQKHFIEAKVSFSHLERHQHRKENKLNNSRRKEREVTTLNHEQHPIENKRRSFVRSSFFLLSFQTLRFQFFPFFRLCLDSVCVSSIFFAAACLLYAILFLFFYFFFSYFPLGSLQCSPEGVGIGIEPAGIYGPPLLHPLPSGGPVCQK